MSMSIMFQPMRVGRQAMCDQQDSRYKHGVAKKNPSGGKARGMRLDSQYDIFLFVILFFCPNKSARLLY